MDLADFLLARLAEDEDALRREIALRGESTEALRRVDRCRARREMALDLAGRRGAASRTRLLATLAVQYSGHPDYDDDWRPEHSSG